MYKYLPKNITSYDLLKTAAVILMIIDHVGAYFLIEELWLRVLGRLCVPMWFFLIGYANSRAIPNKMWIGAGILLLVNIIVGMDLLPLSILATMIVIRFTIDPIANLYFKNRAAFYLVLTVLFILSLPSYLILEYGTQGMIFALLGYFVRNRDALHNKDFIYPYLIFSVITFLLCQKLWMNFPQPHSVVLAIGLFGVCYGLTYFKAIEYPRMTQKMPSVLTLMLQFMGRYTLEVYVAHVALFSFIALYIGAEGFGFFEVDIIDVSMFSMQEPTLQ